MARAVRDQGGISQMFNEDFHTCMFACFLSQEEPKIIHQGLKDSSWIEAIQKELLQFKMQKDERGIVIRNKARLVAQGHTQEEGINYEEKSVSSDFHSSSCGDQTRKQGDKTKNKDKGKSPVVTIIGFRDLNAEFEECNNNSSNRVKAASSLVSDARQNCTYSTNDFSAAVPSNAA
nr:hypothetical protein [Tanacetum cinerariifolium]